ncbi:MAG: Fic family protein [Cyanobacteriota bacterium]
MIDYLTVAEITFMHYMLIEKFGGQHGLRDAGALDAALYRPQSVFYNGPIQKGAALWEGLTSMHPFNDANKRLAFAATYSFLRANNVILKVDPIKTFRYIQNLYKTRTFEYKNLELWLRENSVKDILY